MTSTTKTTASTARASRAVTVMPTIVLKTVFDAIVKSNPTTTLDTKKMRVKLRATPAMKAIHTRNASWIFTQSQADEVRTMFDPAFAKRLADSSKRDAKKASKAKVTPVASVPAPVAAD